MERPTKTFGLEEPIELYRKLLFDIQRLRAGRATRDVQYAAFDCAVSSSHLVDWVLHAVDDTSHVRLSGKQRGKHGIIQGFGARNASRLPDLELCRQIANSVKHVIVTHGPVMDHVSTGSTVRFEPSFLISEPIPTNVQIFAWAYVNDKGKKQSIVDLFEKMAKQWARFMKEEDLFVEELPEIDMSDFDEETIVDTLR